jgi:hypothetical protein
VIITPALSESQAYRSRAYTRGDIHLRRGESAPKPIKQIAPNIRGAAPRAATEPVICVVKADRLTSDAVSTRRRRRQA